MEASCINAEYCAYLSGELALYYIHYMSGNNNTTAWVIGIIIVLIIIIGGWWLITQQKRRGRHDVHADHDDWHHGHDRDGQYRHQRDTTGVGARARLLTNSNESNAALRPGRTLCYVLGNANCAVSPVCVSSACIRRGGFRRDLEFQVLVYHGSKRRPKASSRSRLSHLLRRCSTSRRLCRERCRSCSRYS